MYEGYTVLFVDDDANVQKSIRRLMMDEEFTSYFASSGKEAIEITRQKNISVIVSDMRMPEMNGLDLLINIEKISPMTVKLVLTGYTQIPQILATVNQVDIYKFISKPWESEELVALIKKSIDNYITREEYANQKKVLETQNKIYKNILTKINTVISEAKNSSEIICLCGTRIIEFGADFTFEERKKFKDVFGVQKKLFELLSKGIAFEKNRITLNSFIENLSTAVLPVVENAKICSKTDLNTTIYIETKILETAVSVAVLVFQKEFSLLGFVISVENTDEFNVAMICPGIKYNESADGCSKAVIDIKIEFIQSLLTELLRFSVIKFSHSVINDTLIFKFGIDTERQEE